MPIVEAGQAELNSLVLPGAPGCELTVSPSALQHLAKHNDVVFIGYLGS